VVTSVEESREWGTVWGFFGEKEGPNPTKDVYGGRKREGNKRVFGGG
jgi:hypothetical protein